MIGFIETYNLDGFKRSGVDRATAICPFHDDHNPSLNIDANRGLYKCFSCGAGGDVFHFVRQYHLQGTKTELPFMQAVRYVHDFTKGINSGGGGSILTSADTASASVFGSSSPGLQRMTEEERNVLLEKQDRIHSMNQHAAAFYSNNLAQSWAGGARLYLRSRGFESATAARAFALGYAPDTYFGSLPLSSRHDRTATTSLVLHLKSKGFNASEILESGLAVQKKSAKYEKEADSPTTREPNNATTTREANNQTTASNVVEFSSLMDRFRGRLMVPILDQTGNKVVAFGGRILPQSSGDDDDDDGDDAGDNSNKNTGFKPPKYLNSPETPVFQKKNVLFGHHIAVDAYQRSNVKTSTKNVPASAMKDPLILVEGYMDVLTLWDAGIRTAVATMGTAISVEQITAAAKIASPNGGRVVICLDSDDAGNAAVERLCSGSFLKNAASSFGVQFRVARLPVGVKDPGEFIEQRREQGIATDQVVEDFRTEVLNAAADWSEWYLERIMNRYDENSAREAAGSFGDIFQRVAGFLATFSNPAERTKSAYEISGKLANVMAMDSNRTSISKAARMQLESDLIETASRIASAKESMKRRVEVVNGGTDAETRSLLSAMARGSTSMEKFEDVDKLSRKAFRKLSGSPQPRPAANGSMDSSGRRGDFREVKEGLRPRRRMYRPLTEREEPSLTPHFSGFDFDNQSDADWLGVPRNKAKRDLSTLTIGSLQYYDSPRAQFKKERVKPVYFNSNDYHGNRFLSQEAMNAGYSDRKESMPDYSLVLQKGVGTMVKENIDNTLQVTETLLLENLVQYYPISRNAVQDVLRASNSVGAAEASIAWTSADRQWLFEALMEHDDVSGSSATMVCDLASLRQELACRSDVPKGAFSNGAVEFGNTTASDFVTINKEEALEVVAEKKINAAATGSLEQFFVTKSRVLEAISTPKNDSVSLEIQSEKASLAAQEQLMTLLSTSASKRTEIIRHEMMEVSLFLQASVLSNLGDSQVSYNNKQQDVLTSNDVDVTRLESPFTDSSTDGAIDVSKNLGHSSTTAMHSSSSLSVTMASIPVHVRERYDGMDIAEVKLHYQDLLVELQSSLEQRNKLDKSTKRITEQLMRFSSSTSSEWKEGRISVPLQKQIAENVDNHLKKFVGLSSEVDEDDRLGTRENEGSLADEMAEIDKNWAAWADPDFVWTPGASETAAAARPNPLDDEDDHLEEDAGETLEEALKRIDSEWSNWLGD